MNISTQIFPLWVHKDEDEGLMVGSLKQSDEDIQVEYRLAVVEGFEAGDDWLAVVEHIKACNAKNDKVIGSAFLKLLTGVEFREVTSLEVLSQVLSGLGFKENPDGE